MVDFEAHPALHCSVFDLAGTLFPEARPRNYAGELGHLISDTEVLLFGAGMVGAVIGLVVGLVLGVALGLLLAPLLDECCQVHAHNSLMRP